MNDFARLSPSERTLVKDMISELNATYKRHRETKKPGTPSWPKRLRVKAMQTTGKIFEVTWSFSGPDGRATFEYVDLNGELGIRWRRIGNHEIFREP